jgi:hypothetical protein
MADLTSSIEGTAIAALQKGLRDLQELCDVVGSEFWTKREAFKARQDGESESS